MGSHSADLANFGATADHKSSSAPKFAKNYESTTAIPRILEEENQAENETQTELESKKLDSSSPSLRADLSAWQSIFALESAFADLWIATPCLAARLAMTETSTLAQTILRIAVGLWELCALW